MTILNTSPRSRKCLVLVGRIFILNRGRNARILLVLVGRWRCLPSMPAPHKRALSTGESPAFKLMATNNQTNNAVEVLRQLLNQRWHVLSHQKWRCLPCRHLTRGRSPAFKLMANDDEGYDEDEEEKEGDKWWWWLWWSTSLYLHFYMYWPLITYKKH